MKTYKLACKYCAGLSVALNYEGMKYSGIEMMILGRAGLLRARNFEDADFRGEYTTQDVVNINFCPMCGRSFNDENA